MKLETKFGIEFELNRVKNTLAKWDWYILQGYKPKLPEGINKESSEKDIKEQIIREYNKKRYEEVAEKIKSDFCIIQDRLFEELQKFFNLDIKIDFLIYLTSYGTGGSYNLPNTIILNINNKQSGYKTIVHEIIHLLIENQVKKYEVSHWEKERIVDLILNSSEFGFLDYGAWQKSYNGSERYVDDLFNKHFFKDSEEFFSKIKSVRLQNIES